MSWRTYTQREEVGVGDLDTIRTTVSVYKQCFLKRTCQILTPPSRTLWAMSSLACMRASKLHSICLLACPCCVSVCGANIIIVIIISDAFSWLISVYQEITWNISSIPRSEYGV